MYMALECYTNERSRKNSNYSIATNIATLIATSKADDELKFKEEYSYLKLLSMSNISCELDSFYFVFC